MPVTNIRSNSLPSPISNNNNNKTTKTKTTILNSFRPQPLNLSSSSSSNNDRYNSIISDEPSEIDNTIGVGGIGIERLMNCERGETVTFGNEPSFEMLVIGCGGGPLETNLSSYLLKPYSKPWSEGCTALEGGSGLGALSALVETSPYSFRGFGLNIGVDDHERVPSPPSTSSSVSHTTSIVEGEGTEVVLPKKKEKKIKIKKVGVGREGGGKCAAKVWQSVRCFAVSHAHLDHIQGLIISSGASICPRPLYGTSHTLRNMANVFDGGVWPSLAGWEHDGVAAGRAYLYREITAPTIKPLPLSKSLSLHAFPLSHGLDPAHSHTSDIIECYDSTAFFIKEHITGKGKEMLFFGDVEPDSISKRPLNFKVWQCAAPKIVAGCLSTIFLECSYPTSQPTARLWGHLSPPFVLEELKVLAKLVIEARIESGIAITEASHLPLAGITIVIIHIKDDILTLAPPISPFDTPTTSTFSSPRSSRQFSNASIRSPTTVPHSPLTLSPPLPSVALRRASGSFGTSHNNSFGLLKKWTSTGVVVNSNTGNGSEEISNNWNEGRRASSPGYMGMYHKRASTDGSPTYGLDGLVLSMSGGAGGAGGRRDPFGLKSTAEGIEGEEEAAEKLHKDQEEEEEETESEEEMEEESVHERIERELNELEEEERLGVRFYRVEQGSRIAF